MNWPRNARWWGQCQFQVEAVMDKKYHLHSLVSLEETKNSTKIIEVTGFCFFRQLVCQISVHQPTNELTTRIQITKTM